MPIYRIACQSCGNEQDIFRSVSNYNDLPVCECGGKTERMVCAPMVMNDIQPYLSQVNGKWITSRREHRDHLKAAGCIEVGDQTHHLKPKPVAPPPGLKDTFVEIFNAKT